MTNQITLPFEQVTMELVPLLVLRSHFHALWRRSVDKPAQPQQIASARGDAHESELQTWLSLLSAIASIVLVIVQTCIALGNQLH